MCQCGIGPRLSKQVSVLSKGFAQEGLVSAWYAIRRAPRKPGFHTEVLLPLKIKSIFFYLFDFFLTKIIEFIVFEAAEMLSNQNLSILCFFEFFLSSFHWIFFVCIGSFPNFAFQIPTDETSYRSFFAYFVKIEI